MDLNHSTKEELLRVIHTLQQENAALVSENRNITEGQNLLRSSADKWQSIFKCMPVSMLIWRPAENGFILEDYSRLIDKGTEGFFSRQVGKEAAHVYRKRPEVVNFMQDCFKEKQSRSFEITSTYWGQPGERTLSCTITYISPEILLTIIQDITESKKADDALVESEKKYRTILESIEEGYFEVDLSGKFTFINDPLAKLLRRPTEDLIGVDYWDYETPESAEKLFHIFYRVFETGEPAKKIDYEVVLKDGTHRFHELSASLMTGMNGKPIGFRGLSRDITERKLAEEELRKAKSAAETANRAKSQFLANMSHEIRTPMNAVIGFADMMFDTDLDEDQREYTTTIKRGGEILLSLINDVLDFSKIESGDMELEEIEFDPELVVYDICRLISPRIRSKSIEMLCHIGETVPSRIKGDPTRFRQVLTNLMGNALKFTETGEIELKLEVAAEQEDQIEFHVSVRDTGIGISPDKMDLIFKPFHQADESTTRKYGGTGLGLSISKQIVSLWKGDIWVESNSDRGSIFQFTAWFKKSEGKKPKRYAMVPLENKKVLVVDDNQTNLNLLTGILKLAKLRVVTSTHVSDALQVLKNACEGQDPFDLCISDIQMPELSGYDLARQVRDPKSGLQNLPLIALSSLLERDARKCETVGYDGFLPKPIHRGMLFQLIERLLGKDFKRNQNNDAFKPAILTQHVIREENKISVSILLAEDNPDNQALAGLILRKAGYQVEVADNGRQAVDKFMKAPQDFDLILMDIQMPELDGFEATQLIRKSGFKSIPIIALTAHAMLEDREKCLDAGMDDYVTKPIKREVIYEIVNKWLFQKAVPQFHILLADGDRDFCRRIESHLKQTPYQLETADDANSAYEKFLVKRCDLLFIDPCKSGDAMKTIGKIRKWEADTGSFPIPIIAVIPPEFVDGHLPAGCDGRIVKPVRKTELLKTVKQYARKKKANKPAEVSAPSVKSMIVIKVDPDLEDLIPGFLKNRAKDVDDIRSALQARNYEKIRILGHSMKGAGGGYGFDAITLIGRSLESAAKENCPDRVIKAVEELSDFLEKVEVVFEER